MPHNMTLLVMAAGLGTRFKGEIKQLSQVGPNKETLMDYSINGAMEAGFNRVVFIIRHDIEKEFKEKIENRVAKVLPVQYLFQEIDQIPKQYSNIKRTKPWGTVQTLLSCKDVIHEPFCVINADDFYGKFSFEKIAEYLKTHTGDDAFCMAGYSLKNTLSDNGGVNRGICQIDEKQHLIDIKEVKNIRKEDEKIIGTYQNQPIELPLNCRVSMNLWGFKPSIFPLLEREFLSFLNTSPTDEEECCLPTVIDYLIKNHEIEVTLLETNDKWFGMTFKEDKLFVQQQIQKLIDQGIYQYNLYKI